MGFSELSSAASTQKRLWKQYGRLARNQGLNSEVYRPISVEAPLENLIVTIPVIFSYDFGFVKPPQV